MFGQAMAFHLSLWYTKHDLAKRVGLFISAGALAGAFGGLISFGVNSIHSPKIDAWRILFLIEGCPSLVLAICVALFMPSTPEKSRLLSGDQRTLCLTRLNEDVTQESGSGIEWKGVKRCLTDWKTYVISIGYSCMNLGLGSVGGFLPTIIKGLGYSNARVSPRSTISCVIVLRLTRITGSTFHCPTLRSRPRLHAPVDDLFGSIPNSSSTSRLSILYRTHWLGDSIWRQCPQADP